MILTRNTMKVLDENGVGKRLKWEGNSLEIVG
jgi:hypothetical protein